MGMSKDSMNNGKGPQKRGAGHRWVLGVCLLLCACQGRAALVWLRQLTLTVTAGYLLEKGALDRTLGPLFGGAVADAAWQNRKRQFVTVVAAKIEKRLQGFHCESEESQSDCDSRAQSLIEGYGAEYVEEFKKSYIDCRRQGTGSRGQIRYDGSEN